MTPTPPLNPGRIFETIEAYLQSAALAAAIQLDLFTAIAEGADTAGALAAERGLSEKGVRILCDVLVTDGFLTKTAGQYGCSPEAAEFLDRRKPMFVGAVAEFLFSKDMVTGSLSLAECVRKGGTLLPGSGSVEPENPMWVLFAEAMAGMMAMPAKMIAGIAPTSGPAKVLDIAAGHGLFGIEIALANPEAEITALDWSAVLQVAARNAAKAGVAERYRKLPGSAFEVDFGTGYDLILIPNFLHHFNAATNEAFLKKVHAALKPGGRAVTLEFCPNEDRVAPPMPARFALIMLQSTAEGDAYTFAELSAMFEHAGFQSSEHHLLPSDQSVVVSVR